MDGPWPIRAGSIEQNQGHLIRALGQALAHRHNRQIAVAARFARFNGLIDPADRLAESMVGSNPGSDATRTAMISSWDHSLVEFGQRPDTTKPFKDPPE